MLMLAQNTYKEILIHMSATRDKSIVLPNFWHGSKVGYIFLQPDAKTVFFVAHDKRYEVFLSSEENSNSSKLRRKEVICLWNNHDFLVGQMERMTTIPSRGKKAHPLFDWKISKTDHVLYLAWTVKILQRFQTRCPVLENTPFWTLFGSSKKFQQLHLLKASFYSMTKFSQKSRATVRDWRCNKRN